MTSPRYDLVYQSTLINGKRKNIISATNLLVSAFSNRYSPDLLPECGGDVSFKKAQHNATQLWSKYRKLAGLEYVDHVSNVPELGWTSAPLLTSYGQVTAILEHMREKGGCRRIPGQPHAKMGQFQYI